MSCVDIVVTQHQKNLYQIKKNFMGKEHRFGTNRVQGDKIKFFFVVRKNLTID